MPPPLPGPDHRDQGSYQAANASARCRSAIVVEVSGRKLRRREVAAELVRPPDAPLRVGRRYPAAAPDGSPSRPWDSGVRPAPPSPSSPPGQHSGRRRTWAGGGAGVRSRSPAAVVAARRPSSKQGNLIALLRRAALFARRLADANLVPIGTGDHLPSLFRSGRVLRLVPRFSPGLHQSKSGCEKS